MKKTQKTKTVVVEKPEPTALEKISNVRRSIEWHLEYQVNRCAETKAEFLAAVNKDKADLSYLVRRCAEDLFLSETKEFELNALVAFYKKTIDVQDGGVQVVLDELVKSQKRECARLLESPYRHNSTCAMSNFHQECELRAKAEFWNTAGSFSRGIVSNTIHSLAEWLALETEVLNAYRAHS